ncbi:MAG: DMT family transporter [Peptococcaceae bacterium]
MEKYQGIIFACIVGLSLGLQPAINSTLGKHLTPKVAAFHSIFISFIIITAVALFSRELNLYKNILDINPIYWIGGIFGACIVLLSIITVPLLGASVSMALFVTVQLITSAVLDHFGLLGIAATPLTPLKVLGIIVLIIGVKLILI